MCYDTSLSILTEQQGQSMLCDGRTLRISKQRWIEMAGISLRGAFESSAGKFKFDYVLNEQDILFY